MLTGDGAGAEAGAGAGAAGAAPGSGATVWGVGEVGLLPTMKSTDGVVITKPLLHVWISAFRPGAGSVFSLVDFKVDAEYKRRTRHGTAIPDGFLTTICGNRAKPTVTILSYKFRVKDATTGKHLKRHAWACNQVWNFLVTTQREAERRRKGGANCYWPSAYDLIKLCTGSGTLLGIHSDTIQTICRQFVTSRDAKRRCPRFRASGGPKRALGWVPFIPRAVQIDGPQVTYLKRKFWFWMSREVPLDSFKSGCFAEDARGRWFVVFQCEVADDLPTGNGRVGIDLGLKTLATLSDGATIPALHHYRKYEAALVIQQRAGNKRRVRVIHAKIANARKHQLHEATTRIARDNALIVVGNVNSSSLAKTRMAKSVLDAGWSMFRNMLEYKARRHQARFIIADENLTTQTCSSCGARSGPKGIAGLGMRRWQCSCGAVHDRDHNAAMNILVFAVERHRPVEEIPVIYGGEDVKD